MRTHRTALLVAIAGQVAAPATVAQTVRPVELRPTSLRASSGERYDAQLGRLLVPMRRADPESRTIALQFARVRSNAERPEPPLVYLAGGPGSPATPMAMSQRALTSFAPILEVCDMIFLDQRGTGRSEPSTRVVPKVPIHDVLFLDHDAALERVRAACRDAAAELRARGIDLDGFTTAESADDVDDLRRALDLERISLLGFSYGTHLGQAIMKRHGSSLARVVLCGVEGLDETYKLPMYADVQMRKIARLARQDPTLGPDAPELETLLRRVLARLEAEPMVVQVAAPGGERVDVPVGPFGLLLILRMDIGDASDIPVFPRLLHSIDQGDPSVLAWFVRKRLAMFASLTGMSFVTDAASGASPERLEVVRRQSQRSLFGEVVNFPTLQAADAWDAPDLGDGYRAPLVSDVPTLLLSGTLDWNTPPFQAERLRFGLTNATHVIVENAGHEQILVQPKVRAAIVSFLRGEPVDTAIVRLPPPVFVPLDGPGDHPSVR